MRAAAITNFETDEYVESIELPDPEPEHGEAVVAVESASLNHHDLWLAKGAGSLTNENLPFVPGVDLAGVVDSVGPGVTQVERGDRVVLTPNVTCGTCSFCRDGPENRCREYEIYHGAFAEKARADASRLVPLPEAVSTRVASTLPVAYMTVMHMLRRAEVTPGDLVFVPGATGGVGIAALHLVDVFGATAIGTTSSSDKLDRLEDVGVDYAIHARNPEEAREAVSAIGPVDVTLNHLGGPYIDVGMDVLRRDGRMVVVGRTAGDVGEIDVPDTYRGHKQLIGSTMGTQPELETVVSLVAHGAFEPIVDEEFPLSEANAAFEAMNDRDVFGKLQIRP